MFEDSLVESSGRLGRRPPWATTFSFALQIAMAGVLVLLPLIYTEALPGRQLMSFLEAPAPPPARAPSSDVKVTSAKHVSELDNGVPRLPSAIPKTIAMVKDDEELSGGNAEIPGAVPGGVPNGVPNALLSTLQREVPAAVPRLAVQKVRVSSGVAQGHLVHEVKPQYPDLARRARIQGTVVLQAVIGKDGGVQSLRVISGHPLLSQAALDAVRQWRYDPYYLNGEPVEVDTQINVNFALTGE